MIECIDQRTPGLPVAPACEAIGLSRATYYRSKQPPREPTPPRPRKPHPRKLSEAERGKVLEALHSERFEEQPPGEVFHTLLSEGTYLCSQRTMHRILAEQGESGDRRDQRAPKSHPVPRLCADRPNSVWTWDISKLPTFVAGVFLNLYVVLDLYSRYVVAWMVAERENSALAKQLFEEAIERYDIAPGTLQVHQDRGAPMRAHTFIDLLASLGVDASHSRPRVSNDNAFSEALFKTTKYQPDYPGLFVDASHARQWCGEFFPWYTDQHHHSGLAGFTPADVFFGRVEACATIREQTLADAFLRHPERFVHGPPKVRRPPNVVYINPLVPDDAVVAVEQAIQAFEVVAAPKEPSSQESSGPVATPQASIPVSTGAEPAPALPS
jgi:putative transposase